MRLRLTRRAAALLLALPLALARTVQADAVRLVAADDRGVTLELALSDYAVGPAGVDGRSQLTAPGLTAHTLPGRPVLPAGSALVALPPGAVPVLGAVDADAEEVRDGVHLWLGDRRGFTQDPQGLGWVPTAEPAAPILDGVWPMRPIELGTPFTLRGQRMVAVRIQPFRYDEAAARLWARRRLRVRVEFAGAMAGPGAPAPAAEDPHWDPVLRGAVLNYEQGRRWRTARPAAARVGGASIGPRDGSLFDRSPGLARAAGPAGGAATALFDESDPEVRVQLDTTGVYELPYAALAAKGYPVGVPVGEVSVHRHEFVEDAIPAYQTIELPIEVDEQEPANGVFDGGDRIVVFVRSWAERSGASLPQRRWGDGEVIYATRVARGGLRIGPRSGWLDAAGLTPLASFPWTQRWEKNLLHMPFPGTAPAETTYDQFHWTSIVPYYVRPETLLFEANHLDPTHGIPFTIAWQGGRVGVSYRTFGLVRNGNSVYTPVGDSVLWSGKSNLVVTDTLPGSAVTEGLTNSVVMWGRNGGAPPDPFANAFASASLNWFEATYWRRYRGIHDYLPCNSGDAVGPFEILATGFTDTTALRAYDVTDPLVPLRLTGVRRERDGLEFALRLQDATVLGAPRRYLVFSQPRAVDEARITAVSFPRRALSQGPAGDYLLIAPEAYRGAVQPLVDAREAEGLHVVVSPLETVLDEFNGGRRSAWALKRYIRFALNNWSARFVLLVGDGSEDPQNFTHEAGPDVVPVYLLPGPVGVSDGREVVPSDGWYVWCLNGCPPDPGTGQPPPIVPELFLGRLPVTTVQQATDVVAKLVAYESLSSAQPWRNQMMLFSDDEYSGATTFGGGGGGVGYCHHLEEARFRLLNETIRATVIDLAGLRRSDVELFDLGVWLKNEPVDGFDCRPDVIATQNRTRATVTPELLSRLNAGRLWWNYQGHANETVLAHENFYRNSGFDDDKDLLRNDDKPFLFSAFSCHVNAFAHSFERRPGNGPPIGEDLVVMPRRGSIATWASVGFEAIPDNGTDHINTAWARAMFLDPPHDDLLGNGDQGARTVLGESIALALLRYVPTVSFDPTENGIAFTYTLLGDPATRISIGAPQAIVTANGDTVISDRPVALAPPRDTLHLEADLVSNVQIVRIALIESGSGGLRTIPDTDYTLTPTFPDTAASGRGGRRYHLSFTTPVRPGVLRYTLHTEDRYALASEFNVVFQFFTQLRVSGNALAENDPVAPAADLSLKLALPTPIADPQTQLALDVDSLQQAFTATSLEATGREWLLHWTHDPYPGGTHLVELAALDSLHRSHHFRVVSGLAAESRLLRDVVAFPNPFDDQLGTTFSFYLLADGPADVMLRLFTVSGREIYQRQERGLPPGYHQWAWDGRDAEGDKLGNGVYLYKMVSTTGTRSDALDGRLVKLRRPRHADIVPP
jgi:hypothetical protein